MAKSGFKSAARKGRRETTSKREAVQQRKSEEKSVVSARVSADLLNEVKKITYGRRFEGHNESVTTIITAALAEYRRKNKSYLD